MLDLNKNVTGEIIFRAGPQSNDMIRSAGKLHLFSDKRFSDYEKIYILEFIEKEHDDEIVHIPTSLELMIDKWISVSKYKENYFRFASFVYLSDNSFKKNHGKFKLHSIVGIRKKQENQSE